MIIICNDEKEKPVRQKHKKIIPQVPYKKLKQTQKARISNRMFNVVCEYYTEHQTMPPEDELEAICREMYPRLHSMVPKVSFEDLLAVFRKKQAHFAERIEKNGIPEPRKPKVKKTEAEKLALKRAQRKAKKKKLKKQQEQANALPDWQDDRVFFIAGYTSGGAPYGVTWEEMGLEPWETLE